MFQKLKDQVLQHSTQHTNLQSDSQVNIQNYLDCRQILLKATKLIMFIRVVQLLLQDQEQ